MTKLGKQMLIYRAKNNISLRDFARMVGVTTQTIWNIENGKVTPERITEQKILLVIEGEKDEI